MKILVVVPYFDEPHRWMISGQKTAYQLAKNHEVVVVTTGATAKVELKNNLKIYRLKDIFLPDPINYSFIPSLFGQIKKIVRVEKPSVALINKHMFFTSLAVWPLKRLGLPVIVQTDTFPGINWFPKNKLVGAVMWLYARLIGNPVLRAANRVVLLHEGLIRDAERLGLNYEVIHNGIDLETFDATPPPKDLKKRPGEIWIGYVGRLESVKGWYDLAAVARKMVKINPKLQFFFVGPSEKAEERIKEFRHPQIHFLGLRHDVAGINKLLDIFVMPSLSEGLSNAIMEAMAAGSACVVSNVGGNLILIKEGATGLTFPPGNLAALRRVLTKLIADQGLRLRLGHAARAAIVNSFQLKRTVSQLSDRLEEIAK